MRGDDQQRGHLFSYLSPEERVPRTLAALPAEESEVLSGAQTRAD